MVMSGTNPYTSFGALHIGVVKPDDIKQGLTRFWLPQYPVGPNPDFEWTELGKALYEEYIHKHFRCVGYCDDSGFGGSHEYTKGSPLKSCECFTDECNVDLYFEVNPDHPEWKAFTKKYIK